MRRPSWRLELQERWATARFDSTWGPLATIGMRWSKLSVLRLTFLPQMWQR